MANFLPAVDWLHFHRRNVTDALCLHDQTGKEVGPKRLARFGCATADQALVYLLRRDTLLKCGRTALRADPVTLALAVPSLQPGNYVVEAWDTRTGTQVSTTEQSLAERGRLTLPPFREDLAVAVRRVQEK